jgi:hypothetical protein
MTTVRSLITQTAEELSIIGFNRSITGPDANMALERLNTLVSGIFGDGVGAGLKDKNIVAAETVVSNTRAIVSGHTAAFTITLPETPNDGARFQLIDAGAAFATRNVTVDANGRLIEGATADITASTNGFNRTWFYRGDLADWKRISALAIGDEFPFPEAVDDAFIIMLAMRLAPRFRKTVRPETLASLERDLGRLRGRYRQRVVTAADEGVLVMSVQATGRGFTETAN